MVRLNLCCMMKQRLANVSGVSPGYTPLVADLPGMPIWDTSAYQGRELTSDYLRTSTCNSTNMSKPDLMIKWEIAIKHITGKNH